MHLLIALVLVATCHSWAAESSDSRLNRIKNRPLPKEELDKLDALGALQESLDVLEQSIERLARKRDSDCLKVVGSGTFCACLREHLPIAVDFPLYVRILTTSKDELGYGAMTEEDKEIVDRTLRTRDTCVLGKAAPPTPTPSQSKSLANDELMSFVLLCDLDNHSGVTGNSKKYKVLVKQQQVVAVTPANSLFGVESSEETHKNCKITDKLNWDCRYADNSGGFGFSNGILKSQRFANTVFLGVDEPTWNQANNDIPFATKFCKESESRMQAIPSYKSGNPN